jgi:methyltransferase (TIGR00027 family)
LAIADTKERLNVYETARRSAALRAAHFKYGAEPKIFSDNLAQGLSGDSEAAIAAMIDGVPASSATTCILRSRFTEDRLAAARSRLNQYVVLGAGLDSFALRQGEALGDLVVFEVDDPPFLEWKRQKIAELGLVEPSQLRYVPCDFEVTTLPDALAASDFDPDSPCFISWLGVTQYITVDATKATLAWAAARPVGSEIVFTFVEGNKHAVSVKESLMSKVGGLTYYTNDEMIALVREAGFSQIEEMTEERANALFFSGRSDGLIAPQSQRLLSAIV